MNIKEDRMFIASCITSLEDFLKTDISRHSHIYCAFKKEECDWQINRLLLKREVRSISFNDGYTLYPAPVDDSESTAA